MTPKPKKFTTTLKSLILVKLFWVNSKIMTSKFCFLRGLISKKWFRKVREVCRIHFHPVAPKKTAVVPSYDQKTEKVNEY